MENRKTIQTEKKVRRKLLSGIGLLALLPLVKGIGLFRNRKETISCTPPAESKTIRVLSKNGKLMEIDVSKAKSLGKVSDQELQDWIIK